MTVLCSVLSRIFTIARPEISSTNCASVFMNLYSFGFSMTYSFGKNGIDLFIKLKHDSCELIIPLNSNMFLYA